VLIIVTISAVTGLRWHLDDYPPSYWFSDRIETALTRDESHKEQQNNENIDHFCNKYVIFSLFEKSILSFHSI